jgi:predicted dehydrogenase
MHTLTRNPFSWAVLGPGAIAHRFAEAVQGTPGARIGAVWGRNADSAAAYLRRWPGAAGPVAAVVVAELDDLLGDERIDAVYIATPHDSHAALARACLEAGKPVLCEKPLTPAAATTQTLIDLSRSRGVFLMEALWTRLLPLYAQIRRWLQDGCIGEPLEVESSFCFLRPYDPASRLFDARRAGGTLLDIGIYNLAVTRWVLEAAQGLCPEPLKVQATGRLAPSGVDQHVEAQLVFPGGVVSRFTCAFDRASDNALRVVGTGGEIEVARDFWQASTARLLRPGQPGEQVHLPWRVNGFEYEIEACMRCIGAGQIESPAMPHLESLALARWLDELRRQMGVRYPFESP